MALPYPVIDPVLVNIGPLPIRWYALAYISGILLGWRYILPLHSDHRRGLSNLNSAALSTHRLL